MDLISFIFSPGNISSSGTQCLAFPILSRYKVEVVYRGIVLRTYGIQPLSSRPKVVSGRSSRAERG